MENTYLIIDKKDILVVDPGFMVKGILEEYQDYNFKGVLLTHAHIDHIASIGLFSCPIYIAKEEYYALEDDNYNLYALYDQKHPYNLFDLNVIQMENKDIITFNNHQIKMILTPGHTKGSCLYLLDDNYLFTGDTLFKDAVGRTDLPGGSSNALKQSLEIIKKMANHIVVYPGHDEMTTIGDEKKNNLFLK